MRPHGRSVPLVAQPYIRIQGKLPHPPAAPHLFFGRVGEGNFSSSYRPDKDYD